MRSIGEIDNEDQAKRFGDYLLVSGIPCDIEDEEDGTWSIWVHDDDQIEKAEAELSQFNQEPEDPRYKKAKTKAENIRLEEAKADELAAKRQIDVRTQVFGQETGATPYLTYFMIGLCVLAAFFTKVGTAPEANAQWTITEYVMDGSMIRWLPGLPEIRSGHLWRVITPIFLHFGFMHIIFNLYWLHYLGGGLEGRLGMFKFALFILFTAALSNIGQYIVEGSPSFGGMSGVNYALFGYIWIRGDRDPSFGIQLDRSTITLLLIWFAICFTGLVGNIANTAHTVGLVAGAAWGWFAAHQNR
jgi:GlpG protein